MKWHSLWSKLSLFLSPFLSIPLCLLLLPESCQKDTSSGSQASRVQLREEAESRVSFPWTDTSFWDWNRGECTPFWRYWKTQIHTHTSKYPRLGLLGSEFRLDTSSLTETYTHTQSHSPTALCIFMLLTSCSNRPCSVFFFSTMLLLTLFMCLMFDSFPNFNDVSLYPVVVVSEQWASRGETSPPEISPSLQQEETECLGQYYFKTEKLVDVLPDEISWKTGSWQPPSLLSRWCYTTHLVNKSSAGKKCKLMSLLNLFWTDAVKMLVGCHHFLCQPCEHTTVLR